jgi:putative radical SAM enzyme (TIGR03279 family)
MIKRARRPEPASIEGVDETSPLYGKVAAGDLLLSINGERPRDFIDYLYLAGEEELRLRVISGEGEKNIRLSGLAGESLGLTFTQPVFDGVRTCSNRCVFCFVDRMPAGLRPSLYLKDDDYRLSVLQGNFITLNNLSGRDLERILSLHLSPLYVSLHSSDPALRDRMMGGRSSQRALRHLKTLIDEGIETHLQVVLCPGLNDGENLRTTLSGILSDLPAASAGIVPVGLSGRASDAVMLEQVGREDAVRVLETVGEFQARALDRHGRRLFYVADEFYILAEAPFPPGEEYEDYPQLENGIGMARDFIDTAQTELSRQKTPRKEGRVAVLTGKLGGIVLEQALRSGGGGRIAGVDIRPVENGLFGPGVTVTGLSAGEDVLREIEELREYERIVVPSVMLREGEFLDNVNISRVRKATRAAVEVVETDGAELVRALYRAGEGS